MAQVEGLPFMRETLNSFQQQSTCEVEWEDEEVKVILSCTLRLEAEDLVRREGSGGQGQQDDSVVKAVVAKPDKLRFIPGTYRHFRTLACMRTHTTHTE